MKDMESQGKQFGLPGSAFHFQRSDHHIGGRYKEGLHLSLYDFSLERSKVDTLPHCDQLIDAPLQGSPTGTFLRSLCPLRSGDGRTQLAGQQPCHSHSVPQRSEAVYLTLMDNIDKSVDSAGPHNQRDPSSKIGLIRHHQEHRVLVITCDTPHLHSQDDKPKQASAYPT